MSKTQRVVANAFKAKSGKWYTTEEFEVEHDNYLPRVWERAEAYLRVRFPGEEFHYVVNTPDHPHDHPTMFVNQKAGE